MPAGDLLTQPPPQPPNLGTPVQPPTFTGLAGPQPSTGAGENQIGGAAVRMGMEIDQALKLLAQAIPQLAPWVEKTVLELRQQIGNALNQGAVPTSPAPGQDNAQFPGGRGNL